MKDHISFLVSAIICLKISWFLTQLTSILWFLFEISRSELISLTPSVDEGIWKHLKKYIHRVWSLWKGYKIYFLSLKLFYPEGRGISSWLVLYYLDVDEETTLSQASQSRSKKFLDSSANDKMINGIKVGCGAALTWVICSKSQYGSDIVSSFI